MSEISIAYSFKDVCHILQVTKISYIFFSLQFQDAKETLEGEEPKSADQIVGEVLCEYLVLSIKLALREFVYMG